MLYDQVCDTNFGMAEGLKTLFGQLGAKIDVMETEDQIVSKIPRKQTVSALAR